MPSLDDYKGIEPAWCPGCGNFSILKTFRDAIIELGIEPHQLTVVSGIGQAAKLPHYIRCNTFNGLHGRALPVAQGIKLAGHTRRVFVTTGDGDCYGEGGNHLIHAVRRNLDIKLFVHDNQIYGLTKGQPSPTSMEGTKSKIHPFGVFSEQLNPIALAVAIDCGFVARGFSGDHEHLKGLIKAAAEHKGFALVDILQPCVTFNKINTFAWYKERVYHIEDDHDPMDRPAAFKKSLEWGDKIPIGIIYKNSRPVMEERIPVISGPPLTGQPFDQTKIAETLKEFY